MRLLRRTFGPLHRFAFIFDKDGTLVDTESLFFDAFRRLLNGFGCKHDLDSHRSLMGAVGKECIGLLQNQHPALPQEADRREPLLEALMYQFELVQRERGLPIMPGSSTILHQSREQGIPIGMATSSGRQTTADHLKQLGWTKYFGAVVTAHDVTKHKPEPDVYLEAARRLGVDPANCVAFEDGHRGLKSASAAGMKVVFVRDERFGLAHAPEAHLTVASLEELWI